LIVANPVSAAAVSAAAVSAATVSAATVSAAVDVEPINFSEIAASNADLIVANPVCGCSCWFWRLDVLSILWKL